MVPRHVLNVLILWLISVLSSVNMDVFTAVVKMEELAKVERRMITALQQYVNNSNKAGHAIPPSIQEFHQRITDLKLTLPRPDDFLGNPLNSFQFVKRMHLDWERIKADIRCEGCIQNDSVKKFNQRLEFIEESAIAGLNATLTDYEGAALALPRLWQTYKLDLAALFRGQILNASATPLSIDDILYICQVLDETEDYHAEIMWLHELLTLLQNLDGDGVTTSTEVKRRIGSAYDKNGMPWVAEQILDEALKNDPENDALKNDTLYVRERTSNIPPENRTKELRPINSLINALDGRDQYEALCRGEVKRPINVTSHLKCFLRHTEIPIYRVKEEVFNYDPRISMFYDVITETEMQFIKETADYYMIPSVTLLGDEAKMKKKDIRISQTAWLSHASHPLVRKLNHKVELITGLSTDTDKPKMHHAEYFQVLNYGIGGMYEPHLDSLGTPIESGILYSKDNEFLKGTGDRIATFMFYLSDVTAGGATVYMDIDITVPAVKGAAAFWYNYKRNGQRDHHTYHAGCPVLLGSKWVSNKWIRQEGQIFRRKCGLSENAIDGPL